MESPLETLIDAAACYRLTRLLVEDQITAPLRDRIWAKHEPSSQLGYFITCSWCVSMWVGAGVVAARKVSPRGWRVAARALAVSSVTGMLASHFG